MPAKANPKGKVTAVANAHTKIKKDALKLQAAPKIRPKPRAKPPKPAAQPDRALMEKLAKIGRTNVQKHEAYESKQLLRHKIATHQINHQYQMEHDRLLQASVQGPMQAHAENRLAELKKLV